MVTLRSVIKKAEERAELVDKIQQSIPTVPTIPDLTDIPLLAQTDGYLANLVDPPRYECKVETPWLQEATAEREARETEQQEKHEAYNNKMFYLGLAAFVVGVLTLIATVIALCCKSNVC